jgi:hypothetical protein
MASLYKRNGSGIWWVRFQLNGTRIQRSSDTSKKAQALRFLAKVMEEERQRQEQGYKRVRLQVLCEEYCKQRLHSSPERGTPIAVTLPPLGLTSARTDILMRCARLTSLSSSGT